MEKKTEWYKETDRFVVAEKLDGGPFVVLKNHIEEPSDEVVEDAHDVVSDIFEEHEFRVLMNIVTNHWHAHIVQKKTKYDLTDE
jgi:hypothetical protein